MPAHWNDYDTDALSPCQARRLAHEYPNPQLAPAPKRAGVFSCGPRLVKQPSISRQRSNQQIGVRLSGKDSCPHLFRLRHKQARLAKRRDSIDDFDDRVFTPFDQNAGDLAMCRTRKEDLSRHFALSIDECLHYAPALVEGLHEILVVMQRANDKVLVLVFANFVTGPLPCRNDPNPKASGSFKLRRIDLHRGSDPTLYIGVSDKQVSLPKAPNLNTAAQALSDDCERHLPVS